MLLSMVAHKYILKPVLMLILVVAAISAYAMDTYGYMLSSQTFQSLFATDTKEVFDLITLKLSGYIFLLAIIPCVLIYYAQITYPNYKRKTFILFLGLILVVGNLVAFNTNYISLLRNHKHVRYYLNPIRPVYSLVKYGAQHLKSTVDHTFNILDPNPNLISHNGKPRLVVLVIGEADRAVNYPLNGYARNTTPLLAARADIFNFTQFYSCGTETSVSVPCMFSSFPRAQFNYGKGRYTENVLDLLQKSNVQVFWRDNDGGCKNVCDRVVTEDFNDAEIKPYCNGFECHDEILLHNLDKFTVGNPQDKIIVLHKKGNHGPAYYKRYPERFEVFTPVCKSNELQECTQQEITNAYDNIILYTDYFLNKIISYLETQANNYQTAMIYVSDHGESLGERGVYLHAMPYWIAPKEQIHVPFIFWASQDFAVDRELLASVTNGTYSHDNLFHTLLGMFKVQTTVYEPDMDLLGAFDKLAKLE